MIFSQDDVFLYFDKFSLQAESQKTELVMVLDASTFNLNGHQRAFDSKADKEV